MAMTLEYAIARAIDQASEVGDDLLCIAPALRTIAMVRAAQWAFDNGGARCFFAQDWPQRPPYADFVAHYRAIGAEAAAQALADAVALFPFAQPHLHVRKRNAFLARCRDADGVTSDGPFAAANAVLIGNQDVWAALARFVAQHEGEIAAARPIRGPAPGGRRFTIARDIAAPAERAFAVMLDVERWHEWTASIRSVALLTPAPFAVGSRARVRQPRLPAAVWTVTELQPGRTFTWVARSLGVTTTATHTVWPTANGCRAELLLTFAGRLAPLLARLGRTLTERYLALEIDGLARRSEARA